MLLSLMSVLANRKSSAELPESALDLISFSYVKEDLL